MWLQPRYKLRSPPPLEGRKLPPKRKIIILRNPGSPGAACAYVSIPAALVSELLTPLKDPHFHHPAVFRAKYNQKDDAGAATEFPVLLRLQALAWQLCSFLKITLFIRSKSRLTVHPSASSSEH